ncbi:MAG: glycerophosphoryl diester phosphodiesterase membrane domain-containing protein [Planctomycetes bacterium]|nr:glycerophosphoryl diester phosphodiesterase membrane domain-containing protein [Planctomycetota bacterium]
MNTKDALDPIRSLKAVLRAGKPNAGPLLGWWFGGLAAMFAVYLAVYLPAVFVLVGTSADRGRPTPIAIVLFAVALLVLVVAMIVLQCWWRLGFANLFGAALRTGRCELGTALQPRGRLLTTIGAQFLVAGIVFLTYLPVLALWVAIALVARDGEPPVLLLVIAVPVYFAWFLFLVWLVLGFVFVAHAVAFDGCGAMEAVRRSWALARGRRFALFVYLLVTGLCAMAGLLLCCVGYIATAPLVELMPIEAYLALTRGDEYEHWWVRSGSAPTDAPFAESTAPPPPAPLES